MALTKEEITNLRDVLNGYLKTGYIENDGRVQNEIESIDLEYYHNLKPVNQYDLVKLKKVQLIKALEDCPVGTVRYGIGDIVTSDQAKEKFLIKDFVKDKTEGTVVAYLVQDLLNSCDVQEANINVIDMFFTKTGQEESL